MSSASLKTISPFSCDTPSIHTDCVSAADHSCNNNLTLLLLTIMPKFHPLQVPWFGILTDHDHATSQSS